MPKVEENKRKLRKEILFFIVFILFTIIISFALKITQDYPFLKTYRVVFGLFFLLFFPGYLSFKVFFNKTETDREETVAYSVALSLLIMISIALILNFFWVINISSIIISLLIFILLVLFVIIIKNNFDKIKQLIKKSNIFD